MTTNQIFHGFIATILGNRHYFYERSISIAEISRLLKEAFPPMKEGEHNIQIDLYRKHKREADGDTFEVAVDRTPIITPDIIGSVSSRFLQIQNAGIMRNDVSINEDATRTEELLTLIANYTESETTKVNLIDYLTINGPNWNSSGDCNGLLITSRKKTKKGYTTYPTFIEPENVLDYAGNSDELLYATVRVFNDQQDKKGEWIKKEVFHLYLPDYAVSAEFIEDKYLIEQDSEEADVEMYEKTKDYSNIFKQYSPTKVIAENDSVLTVTNKNVFHLSLGSSSKKLLKMTFYYHGSKQTPCLHVGYMKDEFTEIDTALNDGLSRKSTLFVPYWWKGIGRLITTVIDTKSFQASKDNYAYPIVYVYEVQCDACAVAQDMNCKQCGGKGHHLPKTANEYIGVKLPHQEDMEQRLPLGDMIYQVPVNLDMVSRLAEWIKINIDAFYTNIFGVNIFDNTSLAMTATEVRTKKESENQCIWLLANRIGYLYMYHTRVIAMLNGLTDDTEKVLVDFEFPKYLIPITRELLMETITSARLSGLPNFILAEMMVTYVNSTENNNEPIRDFSNLLSKVDLYYPMSLAERRLAFENILPSKMFIYAMNVEALFRLLIIEDENILKAPPKKVYDLIMEKAAEMADENAANSINPALLGNPPQDQTQQ